MKKMTAPEEEKKKIREENKRINQTNKENTDKRRNIEESDLHKIYSSI